MFKKLSVFSLLLVLVLVMGTVVFAQEKEVEELYFRFVTHGGDDPFWAVVVKGAQDAAKLLNCKVDFDLVRFFENELGRGAQVSPSPSSSPTRGEERKKKNGKRLG
jgi:ABC-type sugar transport system substrate-binding protein